jgi:hypothetical protein
MQKIATPTPKAHGITRTGPAVIRGSHFNAANDPKADTTGDLTPADLTPADLAEIDRQFAPSREHRALQSQQQYLSCIGQLA